MSKNKVKIDKCKKLYSKTAWEHYLWNKFKKKLNRNELLRQSTSSHELFRLLTYGLFLPFSGSQ